MVLLIEYVNFRDVQEERHKQVQNGFQVQEERMVQVAKHLNSEIEKKLSVKTDFRLKKLNQLKIL